jgi:hypothetical protein
LSILNSANSLYLCYLSKPAADRAIYRAIRHGSLRKFVELGVGNGARARQMIEMAATRVPRGDIQYAGLDPFEARGDPGGTGLSLKRAYRMLYPTGARLRLVPGDPLDELARVANSLGKVDLLVFSGGVDTSNLRTWWFVPRLLHERTQVCIERRSADGATRIEWKTRAEIDELAAAGAKRRAA